MSTFQCKSDRNEQVDALGTVLVIINVLIKEFLTSF